jgi:hypothetical protein
VQPIFNAQCASSGCHGKTAPKEGLNLSAGSSYAGLVNVASTQCTTKKRVVPNNPAASYLVDKVEGRNMCVGTQMPKGSKLSAADRQKIGAWICRGALND